MGLTVTFTLLGGVGTTCVALGAENYESMVGLIPYKPLYQVLVVISLAAGVWGIPVTVSLARGRLRAYWHALIVLFVGTVSVAIQVVVSQVVRGSAAPANVRLYVTVFTLVVFLLLRLPPVWGRLDLGQSAKGEGGGAVVGGMALFACGLVTFMTPYWAGLTHTTAGGANWVDVLEVPLSAAGGGVTLLGLALIGFGLSRRQGLFRKQGLLRMQGDATR